MDDSSAELDLTEEKALRLDEGLEADDLTQCDEAEWNEDFEQNDPNPKAGGNLVQQLTDNGVLTLAFEHFNVGDTLSKEEQHLMAKQLAAF